MTRPVAILVLISTLSAGCGSTRYVAYPLTQQTVAEIRHQQPNTTIAIEPLPRGVGALRTAGTPEPHATLLETKADTTIVKVSSTPAPLEVPNTDVRRLVVTNHALGGVYGAGVGALITAGLMALTAASWQGEDKELFSRGDSVALVGLYAGLPTLVLSTTLGAIVGARTAYVVQ